MPTVTLQLGLGLAHIWVRNRSWVSGLVWLETVIARQDPRSVRPAAIPPASYDHLQRWIEQQLVCAEQEGDSELRRLAQLALALVRQAQGRYHETQQLLEAALSSKAAPRDRFPLGVLAELYARTQQYDRAAALYTTCVQLNQTCGDVEGAADALGGLARLACLRRSWNDAGAFAQAALNSYESLDHQHGIASTLCIMGGISFGRGGPFEAIAQYCQSFAIAHRLRDTAGCADVFEALAPVLSELGHTDLVVRAIAAAAALRSADGTHLTPAEQARLDELLRQAATQLGRQAFEHCWQAAHSAEGNHLLALIEQVRHSASVALS